MLPTIINTFEHNEKNKENYQFISTKRIDDDAQSFNSDCFIIEPDIPTSNDLNHRLPSMGILPNSLSKDTSLLIIYQDRITDVRLVSSVTNLEYLARITISHLDYLYSIPKRHLYLSTPCDIERIAIAEKTRIIYVSSLTKKFSLGYICEIPSIYNHSRHLILFDDGSACYTMKNDRIHICLSQEFEQNARSINLKLLRENLEELIFKKNFNNRQKRFQLNNYVRVLKFDNKYHNAQIIDIDCSIIKLKFYERQAKTEIWMHQHSLLISDTIMPTIEIASPLIFQNKRKYDEISSTPEIIVDINNNDKICNDAYNNVNLHQLSPAANDLCLVEERQSGHLCNIDNVSESPPRRSFPSETYEIHRCSSECVLLAEENFNPTCITQNPYTLPFLCGWKYFQIERYAKGRFTKKPTTHKTVTSRPNYLYRSPCGRSLLTLDEIEDYLFETNSKLTIKFFIEHRSTHLKTAIQYNLKYILNQDITQGKEYVKIPVYNNINTNYPESFLYGTEIRSKLTLPNESASTTVTCCSCTDNCRNRIKCPCWLKTFEQAKLCKNEQILTWQRQNLSDEQMILRFGYIHQRLKTPVWSGIYECNSKCSCHTKQCTNRLVQNNLYHQLQLFYTETKGWGLRSLYDIPLGSFINAYVGELITEEMAIKRDFKYLAILDHKSHLCTTEKKQRKKQVLNNVPRPLPVKQCLRLSIDSQSEDEVEHNDNDDDDDDDSCFILDAKHYGSISRFYNHSCKPNVHIQNVFINTHDPRFPVIALFACRNIRAGEEICWDYNYTVGCMPNVHMDCKCQASNCRGRLL